MSGFGLNVRRPPSLEKDRVAARYWWFYTFAIGGTFIAFAGLYGWAAITALTALMLVSAWEFHYNYSRWFARLHGRPVKER